MGTLLVIPKLTKLLLVPKPAESTIWNGNDNFAKASRRGTTLVATDAGLGAIGIEPDDSEAASTSATEAPPEDRTPDSDAQSAQSARTPRAGTKQAALIAMLREPEGVTIEEITAATGWQAHTVRGAIAGALKKKLGLELTSEKVEGRGRVYRLPCA